MISVGKNLTTHSSLVSSLLGLREDIDPRLADICAQRLAELGAPGDAIKLVRYCNDVGELHSFLRDRVFHKDAPTQAFVKQCQAALTQPTSEAAVPRPSDIFQKSYPSRGDGTGLKWKVHRVLGVAPTNIDPDEYEQWCEALALANVDSELPLGEVRVTDMKKVRGGSAALNEFLRESQRVAANVGADVVAFTTLEGLA